MKVTEKIRQYWHDSYYFFASDKAVNFAMTCKDAAQQVDLGVSKSRLGRLRFFLHMSLCQGCKNYLSLTDILGSVIRSEILKAENSNCLDRINEQLLEKHASESLSKS